jgi:23S rRNA pseudouridine2605 synthase
MMKRLGCHLIALAVVMWFVGSVADAGLFHRGGGGSCGSYGGSGGSWGGGSWGGGLFRGGSGSCGSSGGYGSCGSCGGSYSNCGCGDSASSGTECTSCGDAVRHEAGYGSTEEYAPQRAPEAPQMNSQSDERHYSERSDSSNSNYDRDRDAKKSERDSSYLNSSKSSSSDKSLP